MALTLLMATIAIQAGQATPLPKTVLPRTPAPDVLLARADEAVEAEKALNDDKLDPAKLLFLTSKVPVVACYGRLAHETQVRSSWTRILADLIRSGGQAAWTIGKEDALRTLAARSPFRDPILSAAQGKVPMTMQLECTTTVEFTSAGKPHLILLGDTALGAERPLPSDELRLGDVSDGVLHAPLAPTKPQTSVACIVPATTNRLQRVPRMQEGIKRLANVEAEGEPDLLRLLPSSLGPNLTEFEREAACTKFASEYKNEGFASPAQAESAFRGADLHKYNSISVQITITPAGRTPTSMTWTVYGL